MSPILPRLTFLARKHFTRLSLQLGKHQALRELQWMVEASPASQLALASQLQRRVNGEPLQYILGTQPFGSLELFVAPPTLIPRAETEEWTLWLADELQREVRGDPSCPGVSGLTALDLCTGSGCIPLLLSTELPPGSLRTLGVDVSSSAIALAQKNERLLRTSDPRVSTLANLFETMHNDLFAEHFLDDIQKHPFYPFDVITSNPPYITRSAYRSLPKSVKLFEDPLALIGDAPAHSPLSPSIAATTAISNKIDDGLDFYHRIVSLIARDERLLKPGGRIVFEVGLGRAEAVRNIISAALGPRLEIVDSRLDASGVARVVWAQLSSSD